MIRYLFFTLFWCLPLDISAQKIVEITIEKDLWEITGDNPYPCEKIILKDTVAYYAKGYDLVMRINRYPEMIKYLKTVLNDTTLSHLENDVEEYMSKNKLEPYQVIDLYPEKIDRKIIRNPQYYAVYRINFEVIYSDKVRSRGYNIYSFEKNLPIPHYEIILRLNAFFEQFRKEHGCPEFYFVHQVEENETLESINQKYNFERESELIESFNFRYSHILKKYNNNREIWDYENGGLKKLSKGDRILIPCFPTISSPFEKIEKK